MRRAQLLPVSLLLSGLLGSLTISFCLTKSLASKSALAGLAPVPTWSTQDLEFFLYGSMGTEVVPEAVLRAFIRTNPELFPNSDLRNLGLIPDPKFGWPIGISRTEVKHLGGCRRSGSTARRVTSRN